MNFSRNQIDKLNKHMKRSNALNVIKLFGTGIIISIVAYQTWSVFKSPSVTSDPHIAVIKIHGEIGSGKRYGDGLDIATSIHKAVENENVKAILISANSPGGSPVQSEIIVSQLRKAAQEKPIVISIAEMCASACVYIVASSPDVTVTAHRSSMIGNIGVKMDGFGAHKLLETLKVERRTYSAGEFKTFLDPFLETDPDVEMHIKDELLSPVYDQFVQTLKEGRGHKLSTQSDLFSGLIWVGEKAKKLGLIDEIATSWEVRQKLSVDFDTDKFVNYNDKKMNFNSLLTSKFWGDAIVFALDTQNESPIAFK